MTAASHWRVRFWDSTGADDIWLAEVEFIKPDASIAAPTTAYASSSYNADYSADNAFDGLKDSGNGWASQSKVCWIAGSFGTPVEVSIVKLYMGWQSSAYDELPLIEAIALESSDDGVSWADRPVYVAGNNVPSGIVVLTLRESLPPKTIVSRSGIAASAPVGQHTTSGTSPLQTARDVEHGGTGHQY